jgi:DNA-binding PadR family transcriptional regulator
MTCDAWAQDWFGPGRGGRHEHGPPGWLFARAPRGGRPRFDDIEELVALGRLLKGGPFGGPGWGPHRRGRGRARRGDVRLALLRLLAEEPRNGYQLMQAIEERSHGLWRPSPGSVYPTLAQLEDEGLIGTTQQAGARRFQITEAGRQHLEQRSGEPSPWEPAPEDVEHPLSDLGPLVIQIGKAAFQVATAGNRPQREQAAALLADTRRGLYRILAEQRPGEEAGEEDEHEL